MTVHPSRDWKFWAAILGVLVCIIVLTSQVVTFTAYGDVKDQNRDLNAAQQAQASAARCRSEAQAAVNDAQASYLVAQGRQSSLIGGIVAGAMLRSGPADPADRAAAAQALSDAGAEVEKRADLLDQATTAQGRIVEQCNKQIAPKEDP